MIENVAVIIPVYNEAQVIKEVVRNVQKEFQHVICVNDGSTDETFLMLSETNAYIIEHPINLGQGAALGTGIEFARNIPSADYFVTFDADGQHSLKDVKKMLQEIQKSESDIIFGSRFLGEAVDMPFSKALILKLAIKFSNITSGLQLTDTHNGLRVFNKHTANVMNIKVPDMAHASEILEIVAKHRLRYKEVPVTIKYTAYSKSKGQSLINAINIAFDTLLRKYSR